MTALSLSDLPPPGALARLSAASPLLWRTSIAFLAAFAACALLEVIDPRLFNGIGVWIKPAKFFLSLSIHMLTLGFGLALLPEDVRHRLSATLITVTMASMAVLEMLYITFRAARAEASHFNQSSELAGILYSAMGLGSALMMVVTIALGVIVLRAGPRTLLGRATGTGFILAGVLTLIVGFTLGGMGSHWIGGDRTDATGLPVLGWSTTGATSDQPILPGSTSCRHCRSRPASAAGPWSGRRPWAGWRRPSPSMPWRSPASPCSPSDFIARCTPAPSRVTPRDVRFSRGPS